MCVYDVILVKKLQILHIVKSAEKQEFYSNMKQVLLSSLY